MEKKVSLVPYFPPEIPIRAQVALLLMSSALPSAYPLRSPTRQGRASVSRPCLQPPKAEEESQRRGEEEQGGGAVTFIVLRGRITGVHGEHP